MENNKKRSEPIKFPNAFIFLGAGEKTLGKELQRAKVRAQGFCERVNFTSMNRA